MDNPAVDIYYVVGSSEKNNYSASSRYVQAILNVSKEDPSLFAFNRTFFSSRVRMPDSSLPNERGLEISTNLWINRAAPGGPPGGNGTASGPSTYLDIQRRITVYFERLVEFKDTDADGNLSNGDSLVQEIALLNASDRKGPFLVGFTDEGVSVPLELLPLDANRSVGNLTPDSPLWTSLVALKSSAELGTPVAKLNVTALAFLRPTVFRGLRINPTQVKIEILLERSEPSDTSLAVVTRMATQEVGIIHEGGVDWGGMRATSDGISAFFTWALTAQVDGTPRPVGVTTKDLNAFDQYAAAIVFSYPPGVSVVHDPVLGLDLDSPSSTVGSGTAFGVTVVVTVVVIFATTVAVVWASRSFLRRR